MPGDANRVNHDESSRQYQEMFRAAKQRLVHRTAQDIADRAGIAFDREAACFRLVSLGQEISVGYPDYGMTPMFNQWHHIITLHYLDIADGIPPRANLMSFSNLPGSGARGVNFDRESEELLGRLVGERPPEDIVRACEALGASFLESNADLCAVFHYLPRYPLTLKLWFADDELGASGKLLLNENALHYLSIEDAVTVGAFILEILGELM